MGILPSGDRMDALCRLLRKEIKELCNKSERITLNLMPIYCSSRLPPSAKRAQKIARESYTKGPLVSVAMAAVQCFKNAEKTRYQESHHGHDMEYAMSYSQTQCYSQGEKHHSLGLGHVAQAHGHHSEHAIAKTQTHCMGQNNGHHLAHGHHSEHAIASQTNGHHLAHGHHSGHAIAKTQTHCMGQNNGHHLGHNNGHHLGQHSLTHCITQAHGHKNENSACHAQSKKKGEHKKKAKYIFKRESWECKSGDSGSGGSSESESESDNDRC